MSVQAVFANAQSSANLHASDEEKTENQEIEKFLAIIRREAQNGSQKCIDFLNQDQHGANPTLRLGKMTFLVMQLGTKDGMGLLNEIGLNFQDDCNIKNQERLKKIIDYIGSEKYNLFPLFRGEIPILDGYIKFSESDLSAPVMKGVDPDNRPFITLKVLDKETNATFVTTIFQRYKYDERAIWVSHINNGPCQSIFKNILIDNDDLQILVSVIEGNHPRYVLNK